MSDNKQSTEQQPLFDIIRIYAKDCSLETPNSPEVFSAQWKPKINIEFDAKPKHIADDQFEVDLRVTVTCTNEDKPAFICEVHQAGLFLVKNVGNEAADYLLSATAPNILFPYAREHISSMISRASFPVLNLRPINFEALYRARKYEQMQKAKAQQEQATPTQQEQADNKSANDSNMLR